MAENASSVPAVGKEKTSASKGDGVRPRQGSGSRTHANFSSAVSSLGVQRRYVFQAIISVFGSAMVVMAASILQYDVNKLLHLHLNMRAMILVLVGIGVVSYGIGGLSLLKILFVMEKRRAREFGIRLVVGARRGDVRNQLLLEVLFICLAGGIVGNASGLGIGLAIAVLLHLPYIINTTLLLIIMGVSIMGGIICGFYGVRRIMRQDFARVLCND